MEMVQILGLVRRILILLCWSRDLICATGASHQQRGSNGMDGAGSCGMQLEKMTRIWYIARLMIMYFIIFEPGTPEACAPDQSNQ